MRPERTRFQHIVASLPGRHSLLHSTHRTAPAACTVLSGYSLSEAVGTANVLSLENGELLELLEADAVDCDSFE